MRLKDSFVTYVTDGQQIMVDAGSESFVGIVRSNATAAFIVDCLKSETTEAAIVDALFARYNAPRDQIASDVSRVLSSLRRIGALTDSPCE